MDFVRGTNDSEESAVDSDLTLAPKSGDSAGLVVACIGRGASGSHVSDYGNWLAKATGKPLLLLHCTGHDGIEPMNSDLSGSIGLGARSNLMEELTEQAHEKYRQLNFKDFNFLEMTKANLGNTDNREVKIRVISGTLLDYLEEIEGQTAAVVLGSSFYDHKNGEFIGTQVESVVRRISRPSLVVSQPFTPPRSIMIAYDGSQASRRMLDFVRRNSASSQVFFQMDIHVVHSNNKQDTCTELLDEALNLLKPLHPSVQGLQLEGDKSEVISQYLVDNKIGLVVMGAFGHGRLRDLFRKSFTAEMLAKQTLPLMLTH